MVSIERLSLISWFTALSAVRPAFEDKNWVYWCPHQPDLRVERLLPEPLGLHDAHPPSQRAGVCVCGVGALNRVELPQHHAAFGLHYEVSMGE